MEKEFSDLYARAKRFQVEIIIDEILEIADDTSRDITINDGKPIIDHEHINRSRLRIETRKWLASKLCPRLYGNEERINLDFPNDISNSSSLIKMSTEVFRALSNQEISPEQAKILAGVIKDHRNNIVLFDLNERMARFENEANHHAIIAGE